MDLKKLEVNTLPKIKIRKCPHGYGLFAAKNLKKGEVILLEKHTVLKDARKANPCSLRLQKFGKTWWGHELNRPHKLALCFLDHPATPNAIYQK